MNNRAKMPLEQRAKQFAPFDALTGLRNALKEKEKIRVDRKIISEEKAEEINRILLSLTVGDKINVIFYNQTEEEYIRLSGNITKFNKRKKILEIGNSIIKTDDIYDIETNKPQ